eukprot:1160367-Pelagomonas_calceolata.AAC.5
MQESRWMGSNPHRVLSECLNAKIVHVRSFAKRLPPSCDRRVALAFCAQQQAFGSVYRELKKMYALPNARSAEQATVHAREYGDRAFSIRSLHHIPAQSKEQSYTIQTPEGHISTEEQRQQRSSAHVTRREVSIDEQRSMGEGTGACSWV